MNYRDDSFTTHQPRTVNDSGKGTMNHFWDANGNLAQVVDCNHNAARLHEWDEENRLRFVLGEKYAGYYGYDADGERVYKLVGTTSLNQVNGGYMDANVLFDACVLYPNPYMVVTKTGYTKHYYAGTERLATVIGGGGLGEIGNPVDGLHSQHDLDIISSFHSRYSDYDPFEHENNLSEPVGTVGIDGTSNPRLDYTCSPIVLTDLDVLTHQNILLEAIELNAPTRTLEQNVYFFHGDHLGSANWITDDNGKPIQYIHYAPYGELIANKQTIGYDERFKFTGKERDWETGYDYFGARFYDHRKGFWNSVDPLADKYPGNTPYLYCGGNPIMLVDPDGRDWYEAEDGSAVLWKNSNDASISIDGATYNNIGENYNHIVGNTTYGYHQNELASITTDVMSGDNYISQFSKEDWNGTPAMKACNKACDAMLAKAGFKSENHSQSNIIVENDGTGRAGVTNGNAEGIIKRMTDNLLYAGIPSKACVDIRPGSSSADKIGDHFIVIMGIKEYISQGQTTGVSYRFFEPGTGQVKYRIGELNLVNNRLTGYAPYSNTRHYTVSSIRFSR